MCTQPPVASDQPLLNLQTREILSLVEEIIQREQRPLAELAKAQALWEAFLHSNPAPKMTDNLRTWSAALHYLAAALTGSKMTQAVIGKYYQLSATSVSTRAKVLRQGIGETTFSEANRLKSRKKQRKVSPAEPVKELSRDDLLAFARQLPMTFPMEVLDTESLITVFQQTHKLLSVLYPDKTHIEILRYLQHVELNLRLAGYSTPSTMLQDAFATMFPQLGLQPAKGRNAKKFVYLADTQGHREPFVLVKLGGDDV